MNVYYPMKLQIFSDEEACTATIPTEETPVQKSMKDAAEAEEACEEQGEAEQIAQAEEGIDKEQIAKQLFERLLKEKVEAKERQRQESFSSEINQLVQSFPSADIEAELKNPQFKRLIRSGVSAELAFRAIHHDEIVTAMMEKTAQELARNVSRLKESCIQRPQENAVAAASGVSVKTDVSSLSRSQRAELAKRASKGEKISL